MNNSALSTERSRYMRIALEEAKKGLGRTEPNPAVGAVIVKGNRIIAKGYHKEFGGPHAEIAALRRAGRRAKGSTLYVTLEPCCYFGKTPPCTDTIIKSGIKTVIAAMADPNPMNKGKGIEILRRNGIKVITGIMRKEAAALNRDFLERMKRKRPLITVKMAQSIDGKIATKTGASRWISSEESRKAVQRLRKNHDAVMVGVNTLLRDNPRLTLRNSHRQPIKIIVDSRLKSPAAARIFSKDPAARVIIATTGDAPVSKEERLRKKGAEIIRLGSVAGRVHLKSLMKALIKKGIGSILVEGGGELAASLFEEGLVDKIFFFMAPILIGGRDAITSVEGGGIKRIEDALKLRNVKIKRVGNDLLVEAEV